MKRHIKYLAMLLLAAAVQGCLRDGAPDTVLPAEGETEITVAFELLSDGEVTLTRMMDHVKESYIETLDILVFDVTGGDGNSVFLYSVHGYDINNDDEVAKNFKVSLKTAYNDRKIRLFVVVNARDACYNLQGRVTSGVTTDRELFSMLIFEEGMGGWNTVDPQCLPMSGISGEATMSDDIKGSDFGKVELKRSVAGIDVELAYGCNFALEDVVLYNIPGAGYLTTRESLANPDGMLAEPPTFLSDYDFSMPYSTTGMHNMMYVPFKNKEPYSGDRAFYMLVGGRYSEDPAGFDYADKSWYKIECLAPGMSEYSLLLESNFKYRVIINSVSGPGHSKREDAEANGKSMWLNAAIISWEMGGYTYSELSGPYCFDISCKQFEFDYKVRDIESDDNRISLYTDYKWGWKVDEITYESTPTGWLSVDVGWGAPFENNTLNILAARNYSTASRTGYIHLSAGRWQYKVKVTQKKSTLPPPSR